MIQTNAQAFAVLVIRLTRLAVDRKLLGRWGSKPILSAQVKTDLIFSPRIRKFGFYPGITADVEINQNTQLRMTERGSTRFNHRWIKVGLQLFRLIIRWSMD